MELKMYDVGFGEFIKISQNSKQLLIVDCGSKNWNSYFPTPQNIKKPSASIINRNEIQPNSAIMISHTHTDHYNGFQYFLSNNQRFSKLYLAYVISIEDKKNPKKGLSLLNGLVGFMH